MTIEIEGSDANLFNKEDIAKTILFSFIKSVGRMELVDEHTSINDLNSYFKEHFTFNAGEHINDKLVIRTNDDFKTFDDLSFDIVGW